MGTLIQKYRYESIECENRRGEEGFIRVLLLIYGYNVADLWSKRSSLPRQIFEPRFFAFTVLFFVLTVCFFIFEA